MAGIGVWRTRKPRNLLEKVNARTRRRRNGAAPSRHLDFVVRGFLSRVYVSHKWELPSPVLVYDAIVVWRNCVDSRHLCVPPTRSFCHALVF